MGANRLTEQNRRNSAKDLQDIQAAHDAAMRLGAMCDYPSLEAARRSNQSDTAMIQEMHDTAVKLGATCNESNMRGVVQRLLKREGLREALEAWQGASAKGKRCVAQLQARGKSLQSAIAICRDSMGEAGMDKEKARRVLAHLEADKPCGCPDRQLEVAFRSLPNPAKKAFFAKLSGGKVKGGKIYAKDPKTGRRAAPGKKKGTTSGGGAGKEQFDNAQRIGSRDEANAAFKEHTGDLYGNLDFKEQMAINTYSGDDYFDINQQLRDGTCCSTPEMQRTVDGLNSALKKGTMPTDTILYRGISNQGFADSFRNGSIKAGDAFTDNGYASTSAASRIAGNYATPNNPRSVSMEILAPRGTNGAYIESFTQWPGEAEFLLPAGTTFQVINVDTSGPGINVQVVIQ